MIRVSCLLSTILVFHIVWTLLIPNSRITPLAPGLMKRTTRSKGIMTIEAETEKSEFVKIWYMTTRSDLGLFLNLGIQFVCRLLGHFVMVLGVQRVRFKPRI